jgi:hypothetical protein
MNAVSPDKVRAVVTRAAGLFILAVVAIVFFASPMLSFAANPPLQTCGGASDDGPPPQPATFVAAFTVKVGTKPNDIPTFVPDRNFKPAATKTLPIVELVKLKLNNNKIVFALFDDYDKGYGYATDIQREDVWFKFKLP